MSYIAQGGIDQRFIDKYVDEEISIGDFIISGGEIAAGEESSVILANVKDGKDSYGFNAATGDYGDMIEMGILDPAKVTRTAIQAAGSVAGMMITTEAMVTDVPQDATAAAPAMPDMGGMGGMGGMM